MSTGYLIRNVSILGAEPTDLVLKDGVVSAVGSRQALARLPQPARGWTRSTAPG